MKTALFSVFNKTDAFADFAKALKDRDWDIWASAGTTKFLEERGVGTADVASLVGEPILGHRVVTLSREIYAGLLSRPEDHHELEKLGLRRIDLLFCDLYPLKEEMAREGATEESILEKIDIGGPTLLRAAAKTRRIVLSKTSQFAQAIQFIDAEESMAEDARHRYLTGLAAEAETVVVEYCTLSADFNRKLSVGK